MKILLCLISLTLFHAKTYAATALDIAIETTSIRVEYSDISQKGTVRIYDCQSCKKFYRFDIAPKVTKNGKSISFESFMQDYRNAPLVTIFLDPNSLTVLRISYWEGK